MDGIMELFREKQMFATVDNFGLEPHDETICVIVLSYNRPRMLREALKSLVGADQVIIIDDGSDFDIVEAINDTKLDCSVDVIQSPPADLSVRLKTPRLGKMINHALNVYVDTTLITYLCDDDLFDKDWLPTVKKWMHDRPACHIVKGRCNHFLEEEGLLKLRTTNIGGRGMTSGNFVHRIECVAEEDVKWDETKLTSIDDKFLWELYKYHNTWMVPFIDTPALYRRVHNNALSNYCYGYEMAKDGEDKLRMKIQGDISAKGKLQLKKQLWME